MAGVFVADINVINWETYKICNRSGTIRDAKLAVLGAQNQIT